MQCLARAAEFRDDDTGHHVRRVCLYVREICEQLGLSEEKCSNISLAATLHDVGKIGVPDAILLKPGKLTETEFDIMRQHAVYGSEVVTRINDPAESDDELSQEFQAMIHNHCDIGRRIIGDSKFELLETAACIAITHHEKFDGSGYPHGLAGEDIPLEGRIVAVADVFDALTSVRPYKTAMSIEASCKSFARAAARTLTPG